MKEIYTTIPGYSEYGITNHGKVLNFTTGSLLEGSINSAGYCHYRIKNDAGRVKTMGRHRLNLLTHSYDDDHKNLYVNHKNGIKGYDFINNLEWVTPRENVIHAGKLGLTTKCVPVEMRDVLTGEIDCFDTIKELSEFLNISFDAGKYRVKHRRKRIFPEGKIIRLCDGEDWPSFDDVDLIMSYNGLKKPILVRDAFTLTVKEYCSMREASKDLGISDSLISEYLTLEQPVTSTFKQFRFKNDRGTWRDFEDPYIEYQAFTKKKPIVYRELENGIVKIYLSSSQFSKEKGYPKSNICHWLKSKGTKLIRGKFYLSYYTDTGRPIQ